jgi:hypothetical protein
MFLLSFVAMLLSTAFVTHAAAQDASSRGRRGRRNRAVSANRMNRGML